jgi:hypothetical protein
MLSANFLASFSNGMDEMKLAEQSFLQKYNQKILNANWSQNSNLKQEGQK